MTLVALPKAKDYMDLLNSYKPIAAGGIGSFTPGAFVNDDLYARAKQIMERLPKKGGGMMTMKYDDSEKSLYKINSSDARMHWLAIRLRVDAREGYDMAMGFEYLATHYITGMNEVLIFVVQDQQPVILTDDPALFPSDTLVTALRLLKK